MNDINNITLIGRLTRDIEIKYTNSNTAIGNMSIAVNRSVKKDDQWKDEVSFFDVTLWGKIAESLSKYLIKGKQIGISGELVQDRWEKDGQKYAKVKINAHTIQLLSDPKTQGQQKEEPAPDYNDEHIPF